MPDSWTFGKLEANEKGMKPMPISAKAVNKAVVVPRWGSLSTATMAALAAVAVLVVTGAGVGIAAAAGAFNNPSEEMREITNPDPGLYTSMKERMLVKGDGAHTVQLMADDTLGQELSKSVMIDLKNHNLPKEALEEISEITVTVHTKKGHKNGVTDKKTLRPVPPEAETDYNYVDVPPSVWQADRIANNEDGRLKNVSVHLGGSNYNVGEHLMMMSPRMGKGGAAAELQVVSVNATGGVTELRIIDGGKRFWWAWIYYQLKTTNALSKALGGMAILSYKPGTTGSGTGLSVNMIDVAFEHSLGTMRIGIPIRKVGEDSVTINNHKGYNQGVPGGVYGVGSTNAEAVGYGEATERTYPYGYLPYKSGKPIHKNDSFPMVIHLGGGGAGRDGIALQYGYYSRHVQDREPLEPKATMMYIVLTQGEHRDECNFCSFQIPDMMKYLLGTLPQLDTTKILMTGASGGAGSLTAMLRRASTPGNEDYSENFHGVTHAFMMGSPNNDIAEHFEKHRVNLPIYYQPVIGDGSERNARTDTIPRLLAANPNARATVIQGKGGFKGDWLDPATSPLKQTSWFDFLGTIMREINFFQTGDANGPGGFAYGRVTHMLASGSLQGSLTHKENEKIWERRTDAWPHPENKAMAKGAWNLSDEAGLNKPFISPLDFMNLPVYPMPPSPPLAPPSSPLAPPAPPTSPPAPPAPPTPPTSPPAPPSSPPLCSDNTLEGTFIGTSGYTANCLEYRDTDIAGGWGDPCPRTVQDINMEWQSGGTKTFTPPSGFTTDNLFKDLCPAACDNCPVQAAGATVVTKPVIARPHTITDLDRIIDSEEYELMMLGTAH